MDSKVRLDNQISRKMQGMNLHQLVFRNGSVPQQI